MAAQNAGGIVRWIWAAGSSVAVVGLLAWFFNGAVPPPNAPTAPEARRTILIDRSPAGSALRETVELLDPAPLFLPTKLNAAQKADPRPEPGGTFQNDPSKPRLRFVEPELKLGLPVPVAVPANPAEALAADGPGALAAGSGRAELKVVPLAPRGAVVKIVAARTGLPVLSGPSAKQIEALAAQAHPPPPPSGQQWQPMEFIAVVDPAGLVGPPEIVETRSGEEEVERYFKNYLVRTLRVGERLAPGFYRISVGP